MTGRNAFALPARTSNGMLAMLDGIRDSLPPLAVGLALPAAPAHRLEADDPQAVAAGAAIVDANLARGYGDDVKRDAVIVDGLDGGREPFALHTQEAPAVEPAYMASDFATLPDAQRDVLLSLRAKIVRVQSGRFIGQSRLPRPQPDPRERRA